jgi:hypothetical protein
MLGDAGREWISSFRLQLKIPTTSVQEENTKKTIRKDRRRSISSTSINDRKRSGKMAAGSLSPRRFKQLGEDEKGRNRVEEDERETADRVGNNVTLSSEIALAWPSRPSDTITHDATAMRATEGIFLDEA